MKHQSAWVAARLRTCSQPEPSCTRRFTMSSAPEWTRFARFREAARASAPLSLHQVLLPPPPGLLLSRVGKGWTRVGTGCGRGGQGRWTRISIVPHSFRIRKRPLPSVCQTASAFRGRRRGWRKAQTPTRGQNIYSRYVLGAQLPAVSLSSPLLLIISIHPSTVFRPGL